MYRRIYIFSLLLFICIDFAVAQEDVDWPSSLNYFTAGDEKISYQICIDEPRKHRELISGHHGIEYYCSGQLHAEGKVEPVRKAQFAVKAGQSVKVEYRRTGYWRVYFDTLPKIVRSEGFYQNGKLDGLWKIYSSTGHTLYECHFVEGILREKILIDDKGFRQSVVSLLDIEVFMIRNGILLILLAVLPIIAIRFYFNVIVYNRINGTKYIPFLQNWQRGGHYASIICLFTFWWSRSAEDSPVMMKYKNMANMISVTSVVIFVVLTILFLTFSVVDR